MVTKRQLKTIERKLNEERAELQRQLEELERQTQSAQADGSGEPSMDDDYADTGTATFERERDLSLVHNLKDILVQVERALERIEEGSYGTCESCQKTIEPARIEALPYANLCVDCKKREERRL